MHPPRFIAAGSVLLVLWIACSSSGPRPPEGAEIRVLPGFGGDTDGRREAWLRYARGRIEVAPTARRAGGSPDPPPFEEEVFAREFMARVWRELAEEQGFSDPYLSELGRIESEGYMREYTWHCLHVLRGVEPDGLRQAEFRDWFAKELPDHTVETRARAISTGDIVLFEVGRPAHEPYACTVMR